MSLVEEILHDPSAAFSDPIEVLCQKRLTRDEKVRILEQWRYDLVQLQVASEENLIGDSEGATRLKKVDDCLKQLAAES